MMKKKHEPIDADQGDLQEFLESIEKEIDYKGIMNTLNNIPKVDVISFGIPSLDRITGIGGVPRGRISEIYGAQSSTKTMLSLQLVSQAQKIGIKCAFIDAEMAMTQELSQMAGVNMKELVVGMPTNGEEAFELVEALAEKGYGLIIVDSVSALVPDDEIENDYMQQSIGLQARLMSKGMRKIAGCIMRNNTALVFINQIRETVNKFGHGDPTTTSGGRALKFYASLRIKSTRIGWITKVDEKVGMEIKILTEKNKLSTPQRETVVSFYFGKGFSIGEDILKTRLDDGTIEQIANSYFIDGKKIGSRPTTVEYLEKGLSKAVDK